MLHVKIAEINRSATRTLGVSWLYARGQSLIGSAPTGINAPGVISTTTSAAYTQASNAAGFVKPIQGTFGGTATASPSANSPLFGVFNAGHFSLFIEALRNQQPREDPRRAQPGRPRRTARAVPGRRDVPVPRSPKLFDPGGNGRGDRPVSTLRRDPHVSAGNPGQRRDPARRRAGHQRAQFRSIDDG